MCQHCAAGTNALHLQPAGRTTCHSRKATASKATHTPSPFDNLPNIVQRRVVYTNSRLGLRAPLHIATRAARLMSSLNADSRTYRLVTWRKGPESSTIAPVCDGLSITCSRLSACTASLHIHISPHEPRQKGASRRSGRLAVGDVLPCVERELRLRNEPRVRGQIAARSPRAQSLPARRAVSHAVPTTLAKVTVRHSHLQ